MEVMLPNKEDIDHISVGMEEVRQIADSNASKLDSIILGGGY